MKNYKEYFMARLFENIFLALLIGAFLGLIGHAVFTDYSFLRGMWWGTFGAFSGGIYHDYRKCNK